MAITPGCLSLAHMKDGPMIRVRLPGGAIGSEQLRAIARLSHERGNGLIDLTNRGNLQVRGLDGITLKPLKKTLGGAGLLPVAAWADRLRNIAADPLDGIDPSALTDTRPVVAALDRAIQATPSLRLLTPEFEFVVDNGGISGLGGLAHDVGLIAEKGDGGVFFRLSIAGEPTRLVAEPDTAPALALAAAHAAIGLSVERQLPWSWPLLRHGWNPASRGTRFAAVVRSAAAFAGPFESRWRRLVAILPWDDVQARIVANLSGEAIIVPTERAVRRFLRGSIGVFDDVLTGDTACGLGVAAGRMSADKTAQLADWAEDFGDGTLRLTPWHVVFIPHVSASRADDLIEEAQRAGFVTDPGFVRVRVYACSGAEGCRGGKLNTKEVGRTLLEYLSRRPELTDRGSGEPLTIHVSGCLKGCARRQVSDVLALERDGGYDLYRDSAAGVLPAAEKHEGFATPAALPDQIAKLLASQGGKTQGRRCGE